MILESQICQVNVGICFSLLARIIYHGNLKWLSPNEPAILFCMEGLVRLLMAETHHYALRLLESCRFLEALLLNLGISLFSPLPEEVSL